MSILIVLILVFVFSPLLLHGPLSKLERGEYVPVLSAFKKAGNLFWQFYALGGTLVFLAGQQARIDGVLVPITDPLWRVFLIIMVIGAALFGAFSYLCFEQFMELAERKTKPLLDKYFPRKEVQS